MSRDLFIDAFHMSRDTLRTLQDVILEHGQSYPEFGERIPLQYQSLQEKIGEMRKDGKRVIPYSLLEDANASLETPLSSEELEVFVQYQHNCGFLLHFSDFRIRNFVILDPKLVIDATKCIITSKIFAIETWDEEKWNNMLSTGKIDESYILTIWEKTSKDVLFEHREFLLLVLQRLDIIVKPKVYDSGNEVSVGFYYAPCMLQGKVKDTETTVKQEDITIAYTFKDLLPPAVVHKVFAACLGLWPVVANCLYDGWALLRSGPNHSLLLRRESNSIVVSIQHRHNAAKTDANRVRSIKHFLVQTIQRIVSVYDVRLENNTDKIYKISYNRSATSLGIGVAEDKVYVSGINPM